MAKYFEATCSASVVSIDGFIVDATILSQGTHSSTGIVIIDGATAVYIASSALDVKTLIESINSLVTKVTTALSGLDGGAPTPGLQASNIALITTANATLLATKDNLR